jgi:hypothetical protein
VSRACSATPYESPTRRSQRTEYASATALCTDVAGPFRPPAALAAGALYNVVPRVRVQQVGVTKAIAAKSDAAAFVRGRSRARNSPALGVTRAQRSWRHSVVHRRVRRKGIVSDALTPYAPADERPCRRMNLTLRQRPMLSDAACPHRWNLAPGCANDLQLVPCRRVLHCHPTQRVRSLN